MVLRKSKISLNEEGDLVQKILLQVWKCLPKYSYQKEKFRTWLSKIIRNAIITHINRFKDKDEKHENYLKEVNVVSESAIEEIIHKEWFDYVATLAMKKVEEVFSGNAIQVFILSLEDNSARQIATPLDFTEESVFVLRSRVKARLKKKRLPS